jgi:DNA invertase Pin-like site-specific DNA recombinase
MPSKKRNTDKCSSPLQMKKRKFESTSDVQAIENQISQVALQKEVVIYARCSTKAQDMSNENHCSLSTQVGICTSYCEREGYKVIATETEIASARNFQNQTKLLSLLRKYKNCLLMVADSSRLSRDFFNAMIFLQECDEKNIQIISVREGLDSNRTFDRRKLIDFLQVAQEESDRISMRIRSSFEYRKSKGLLKVKPNFGSNDAKEKDTVEIIQMLHYGGKTTEIKKLMRGVLSTTSKKVGSSMSCLEVENKKATSIVPSEVLYGNFNCDDVAHILNEEGILKRGNPWSQRTIRQILKEYKDEEGISPSKGK